MPSRSRVRQRQSQTASRGEKPLGHVGGLRLVPLTALVARGASRSCATPLRRVCRSRSPATISRAPQPSNWRTGTLNTPASLPSNSYATEEAEPVNANETPASAVAAGRDPHNNDNYDVRREIRRSNRIGRNRCRHGEK